MILKVLGSSSKGNCYILKGETSSILIEAGIKINHIKMALDFDLTQINGCIVSHNHKDHSVALNDLLINGIPVFTSRGTAGDLQHHNLNIIKAKQTFKVGEFKILAFDTIHDVDEPLGFMIEQEMTGERLLFATDTYYIKYKFKGLNYLLVEANHSNEILEQNQEFGSLHPGLKKRVQETHMSLETLKDFMLANDISQVKKIVLIHLSDRNSNADQFKKDIEELTGKETLIAEPGMEIQLEICPF